jgi:hypothetical protein
MRRRQAAELRCSYVIGIDGGPMAFQDLRSLGERCTLLTGEGCEVVVVDASAPAAFDDHRRVLRWVARHLPPAAAHLTVNGSLHLLEAAADFAQTNKVVVATPEAHYRSEDLQRVCDLLEEHEVVVPSEYLDPLPWWARIDAGRMLLQRAVVVSPDAAGTFGFRRDSLATIRRHGRPSDAGDILHALATQGMELHDAADVFIRRTPPALGDWWRRRPHESSSRLSPAGAALFLTLIPLLVLAGLLGGAGLMAGFSGALAFSTFALAVRGRLGAAARYFPVTTCLFAPIWLLERSLTAYRAVGLRLAELTHAEVAPSIVATEVRPAYLPRVKQE